MSADIAGSILGSSVDVGGSEDLFFEGRGGITGTPAVPGLVGVSLAVDASTGALPRLGLRGTDGGTRGGDCCDACWESILCIAFL